MNIRLENLLERLIGILRRTPTAIFGRIAHKLWVILNLRNRMQGFKREIRNRSEVESALLLLRTISQST